MKSKKSGKVMSSMINLKEKDVVHVQEIIGKARKAKSVREINRYSEQLKRIDARNRRKDVTRSVLARYKASE